jgi:hypothetical protein
MVGAPFRLSRLSRCNRGCNRGEFSTRIPPVPLVSIDRGFIGCLVSKFDRLEAPTTASQCGSLWIDKSTALGEDFLLLKTGSKNFLACLIKVY